MQEKVEGCELGEPRREVEQLFSIIFELAATR